MLAGVSHFFSRGVVIERRVLWWAWAVQASAIVAIVAIAVFVIDPSDDDPGALVWAIEAVFLAIYLLSVATCAILGFKRLQARGRSPWWSLIALVPVVGPPIYIREVGFRRDDDRSRSGQGSYKGSDKGL